MGIDHDFRIPGYFNRNGINRLIDDPNFKVVFLSKERKKEVIDPELLTDFDVFVSRGRIINSGSLNKAFNLTWIGRFGVGFDNVDVAACTARGILVSNSPQGMYQSVAETVLGYITALNCKLKFLDGFTRTHDHIYEKGSLRRNVSGKTLGFIGFGGIALRILELVRPLQMKILAYDPYCEEEYIKSKYARKVSLKKLLQQSDFISLNVPLTERTRGMLQEEHFRMMKETAYFINTSRGGLYQDAVLAEALKKGWIAGAGIDVFENEPYVGNNPLLEIEQTILTPHAAGGSHSIDAVHKTEEIIIESILNIKKGEWPLNILNPAAVQEGIPSKYLSPSYKPL